jgi:uncharacterized protein YbjT (DUF2867 family)
MRQHRTLFRLDSLEKWRRGEVDQTQKSLAPLSLLQEALVGMAHRLNVEVLGKPSGPLDPIRTEHEAAVHIHESLARFLKR